MDELILSEESQHVRLTGGSGGAKSWLLGRDAINYVLYSTPLTAYLRQAFSIT